MLILSVALAVLTVGWPAVKCSGGETATNIIDFVLPENPGENIIIVKTVGGSAHGFLETKPPGGSPEVGNLVAQFDTTITSLRHSRRLGEQRSNREITRSLAHRAHLHRHGKASMRS